MATYSIRSALTSVVAIAVLFAAGCSSHPAGEAARDTVAPRTASIAADSSAAATASAGSTTSAGSTPSAGPTTPEVNSSAQSLAPTLTTVTVSPSSTLTASSTQSPGSAQPAVSPAPACWTSGSCPALATASLAGGWKLVAVNLDENTTVMILLSGKRPFDQLKMRNLGTAPAFTCIPVAGEPTCLLQGVPGAHTSFGTVVQVAAGRIQNLTNKLAGNYVLSESGLTMKALPPKSALIVGSVSTFAYGLSFAASPEAWQTTVVTGRTITRTGCSQPSFEQTPVPKAAAKGPCSGTPQIAGYGPRSAGTIFDLDLGIVSQSKNIWCAVRTSTSTELDCTIGVANFTVPGDCVGEPGIIVVWPVGGRPTISACQRDAMVQAGTTVIPYGRLAIGAGFSCVVSETSGVRCTNAAHHGFTLARAGYATF